ncbi:hypothetical protein Rsub_06093 [Raphidocelis subcapitata]|uniref:Uncharacterized protein n=1 Tax=Raphidocelis subcapitata TaxID=307507 RepID=A0A2V0P1K5_9CHLO|nr:hypothetical protein Rsub_06093 [Raphidocelis subcapitata]|eukprot:GBF93761.1 hypothetical protein Rsub_06093 [Raphidocelis subcapitata]
MELPSPGGSGSLSHGGDSRRRASVPRRSSAATGQEIACPSLVVFSGGTAFNSLAGHLRQLTTRVAHVLPVSDDGGSTAEIVRVLGGPAVGDIRSRCLRLADDHGEEARAVKHLLAHRLPQADAAAAKAEWYQIVEGQHALWDGVSEPYKHMIRSFLVHFQMQILSHSTEQFNFANGSIGNFFFAGSRTFFRSLESAIFLFSRVARIPEGSIVLPAICTEERITLGAELEDGTVIKGQNTISHPTSSTSTGGGDGGDGGGDGGSSSSNGHSRVVDKTGDHPPLPSPIRRVFYLSQEGTGQEHEVYPPPNPRILSEVRDADAILYGIGSLYTSICPSLILDGVGEAIAARPDTLKIMLLNGSHDRETSSTGAHDGRMRASDVVAAVADALNRRRGRRGQPLRNSPGAYVSVVVVPRGSSVEVDGDALELMGVREVVEVDSATDAEGRCVYDPDALVLAIGKLLFERGVLACM